MDIFRGVVLRFLKEFVNFLHHSELHDPKILFVFHKQEEPLKVIDIIPELKKNEAIGMGIARGEAGN